MGAGASVLQASVRYDLLLRCASFISEDASQDPVVLRNLITYFKVHLHRRNAEMITFNCDLLDFEDNVQRVFDMGLTPLIVDTSPDDKVCTYYSYQPDCVILEATTMVVQKTRIPLVQCLEFARKYLVNAMKHGKTLIIRLSTSAPDFKHTFTDKKLEKAGLDTRCPGGSFFPEELFESNGAALRDPESPWPLRLFRDEDMKPHKNFAYCRDTFKVLLASQLPLEQVTQLLWQGRTPHLIAKHHFAIVNIDYSEKALSPKPSSPVSTATASSHRLDNRRMTDLTEVAPASH